MTQAILKASNMQESILKNVAVQVPTGDFLVNQMRAGSLDAAIVYLTNVQQVREHFDVIHLPAAYAKAVQPFAVRVDSKHRELSQRLLGYLKSHKESFEAAGFVWTGEETPVPSDKLDIPSWLKQP
jgi:ABC-type molybdate transport system substrate-binding protein